MNSLTECTVCCTNYDEDEHRPRTVPCGHSFCTSCISRLIRANQQLSCPDCRVSHSATSLNQFPVNYGLEAVIKQLKETQLLQIAGVSCEQTNVKDAENVSIKVSSDPKQKRPSGMSKKLRSLLEEQVRSLNSLVTDCQDTQCQLDQYLTHLVQWEEQHLQLQDKVVALITEAVMLIGQEKARVVDMKQEGKEGENQLHTTMGMMQTANTLQEADTAIDHADQCSVQVECWKQKCLDDFPHKNTITTSMNVCEAIRTALDTVPAHTNATHTPALLPHPHSPSTIMDKLSAITQKQISVHEAIRTEQYTMPAEASATHTPAHPPHQHLPSTIMDNTITQNQISVQNLLQMTQRVKTLVEGGQVYAVQQDQDGILSSQFTINNNNIYMSCLQDQRPPPNAHTLQVSEVMKLMDLGCNMVYLNLGWDGSTRGRVHIRLSPNTPMSIQFMLLCSGQQRHSYRRSILRSVEKKGEPGEYVWGGDYEGKRGYGGLGIIDTSTRLEQYRQSGRAGAVWGCPWIPPKAAQFAIITRDRNDDRYCDYVFGEVDSGLEVVRAAANHHDINQVTVMDCGIVINQ